MPVVLDARRVFAAELVASVAGRCRHYCLQYCGLSLCHCCQDCYCHSHVLLLTTARSTKHDDDDDD